MIRIIEAYKTKRRVKNSTKFQPIGKETGGAGVPLNITYPYLPLPLSKYIESLLVSKKTAQSLNQ